MNIETIFLILFLVISWFVYRSDKNQSESRVKGLEDELKKLKENINEESNKQSKDDINLSLSSTQVELDEGINISFIAALDSASKKNKEITPNYHQDIPVQTEAGKSKNEEERNPQESTATWQYDYDEIFKVEEINPDYFNGIKNYKGYRINLEEFRAFNIDKGRPAHYKLPYTPEEIRAVQESAEEGMSIEGLASYYQRRISVLNKMIDGVIEPSSQFSRDDFNDYEDPKNLEVADVGELEKIEKNDLKIRLEEMGKIHKEIYHNVPQEKIFLSNEIIDLLIERRPTTKRQVLVTLGSKRQNLDHNIFVNEVDNVIELIISGGADNVTGISAPEILDEDEASFEEFFISRDHGRELLLEIREAMRQKFPSISKEVELLKDSNIESHLSFETDYQLDDELSAVRYFTKRLSLVRREEIIKAIAECGYNFKEAYTDWLEEIYQVLLQVDHTRIH
jgi:hypothetical protein